MEGRSFKFVVNAQSHPDNARSALSIASSDSGYETEVPCNKELLANG